MNRDPAAPGICPECLVLIAARRMANDERGGGYEASTNYALALQCARHLDALKDAPMATQVESKDLHLLPLAPWWVKAFLNATRLTDPRSPRAVLNSTLEELDSDADAVIVADVQEWIGVIWFQCE